MSRQVAAVNAGNIARVQRGQRAGVVPVIEMAAEMLEFIQCIERLRGTQQQFALRDITEVHARSCLPAATGRYWSAKCDEQSPVRDFLIVIRRQPVLLLVHEGRKERPGFTAGLAQETALPVVQITLLAAPVFGSASSADAGPEKPQIHRAARRQTSAAG